jgi:hypothetical protein
MKLVARGGVRPALAPTVAFAFCDLAGAGPRALMALEPPPGCTMSAAELDVEGLPGASRAFAAESARSAPVELITFADASGAPHTSLLLLLAPVPEAQQTAVAAAVFEFVTQAAHGAGTPGARAAVRTAALSLRARARAGAVSRFVVVAAMRFPSGQGDKDDVRAVALNGASAAGLPSLPADTLVSDGLLASLLHFCRAGGTPTLALLAPGFRVRLPGSAVDDEAVAVRATPAFLLRRRTPRRADAEPRCACARAQVACRLAGSACTTLGCSFSPDAAKLRAKLVAWNSAADAEASVMYV